jgi:transcriptional regulator EpsA
MTAVLAQMPDSDPARFLDIADQGAGLETHADLWRWLQGAVQGWLAHDIMLVGWGDFRSGDLHFDLVSSLPGVRSHNCQADRIAPLIHYFRDCWAAARHLPCHVDMNGCAELLGDWGQAWAPNEAIASMRTAVVHGIGDGKHCGERIFVAMSRRASPPAGAGTALRLLLPFIDTALRRMPPAPVRQAHCERNQVETLVMRLAPALSERERQIMVWVALGKTNPEIGCILQISEFTVKNHMKSIFGKLDVSNRAQAVAKLTRMDAYA